MKKFNVATLILGIVMSFFASAQSITKDKDLEAYQAQSAEQKQNELWKYVLDTSYKVNSLHQHLESLKPSLHKLVEDPNYLKITFTHTSDEMPEGRIRLIHANGSVAQVKLIRTEESKYTGLFQTGAQGIVRLSLAVPPILVATGKVPFLPGMGLKLLIDGKESVNLMTMNGLDGQKSHNFFAADFTNDLPEPTVTEANKKMFEAFKQAVNELVPGSSPTYLTLAPWSRVKSDGSVVDAPVTPHALVLVPTAEAQNAYENACAACLDFRDRLATLVPETTLYDIYTKETKESKAELWGKLVLTTGFKASAYGDNQLFFRHHLE